jgi:hypothetical protein
MIQLQETASIAISPAKHAMKKDASHAMEIESLEIIINVSAQSMVKASISHPTVQLAM